MSQHNSNANKLFYGDNLHVLRDHIADESVDLIYLDPPFNSKRDYNLLFKTPKGMESDAQITAFEDSWHWTQQAEDEFKEIVNPSAELMRRRGANTDVADLMRALRSFLKENDMLAYLTMMCNRLLELHRVLKPTGSLYLHCDPTASHYLKLVLDGVFGKESFRSEIIWRRTGSHNKATRWAPIHDTIFFYVKSDNYTWTFPKRPYMLGHVQDNFVEDPAGRWRTNYYGNVLTGSGTRNGESGDPWQGFDPTAKGRHWAIPGAIWEEVGVDPKGLSQRDKLNLLLERGFIKIEPGAAWPVYERTITPSDGPATSDLWTFQPYTKGTVFGTNDVSWLKPQDAERLGYPTQKPIALLERILSASSNEGDLVLDPFCGCGTAVHAAEKLNRRWIGIDITHLSVSLIEKRMKQAFPALASSRAFEIIGIPRDLDSAKNLAERDKYQFQFWACTLVNAQPYKGGKKGADGGVDGIIYAEVGRNNTEKILVSVKGGANISNGMIRDLQGAMDREKAIMGLFITLTAPTKPMIAQAVSAGHYENEHYPTPFPKLQILSIKGLLSGTERALYPDLSMGGQTFVTAKKEKKRDEKKQLGLI